jgi:hypothetical protein
MALSASVVHRVATWRMMANFFVEAAGTAPPSHTPGLAGGPDAALRWQSELAGCLQVVLKYSLLRRAAGRRRLRMWPASIAC